MLIPPPCIRSYRSRNPRLLLCRPCSVFPGTIQNHKYNSQSYYLESYSCKKILENKTFINTLANLRLNGEVYEIAKWFDDIVGREGTYKELILLLKEINELELEYANRKIFKSIIFNKIKSTSNKIIKKKKKFDRSVNYR